MKAPNSVFQAFTLFAIVFFLIPELLASQHIEGSSETIKIGLLIPDNKYEEARFGAEMAIQEVNENGGIKGLPVELITRSMEGPWGTGSKEAVNLVFKENVWAIMGSHDGRNAHLVEQVITKTRIVFLSAWATDPTLSQAFVPWYFSCVPNDNQQATAFVDEIIKKRKITKIATVTDDGYDSNLALKSFVKKSKIAGNPDLLQLSYDNSYRDFSLLLYRINKENIEGIVFFGQPAASLRFMQQLRQKEMIQSVFGGLSIMGENGLTNDRLENYENIVLVNSVNWLDTEGFKFKTAFQNNYDKKPGVVAAYAFDGMHIIIESIRNSDLDREKLQKSFSDTRYEGVTGFIHFDKQGKRVGTVGLIEMKNGIPVKIEK